MLSLVLQMVCWRKRPSARVVQYRAGACCTCCAITLCYPLPGNSTGIMGDHGIPRLQAGIVDASGFVIFPQVSCTLDLVVSLWSER